MSYLSCNFSTYTHEEGQSYTSANNVSFILHTTRLAGHKGDDCIDNCNIGQHVLLYINVVVGGMYSMVWFGNNNRIVRIKK